MKKSIFLFFAAILCALSVQAKDVYAVTLNLPGNGSNTYCHNWQNTNTNTTSWPGTKMTKTSMKAGSYDIYKCTLKAETNNKVIFSSNGSSQSNTFTLDSKYPQPTYANGSWWYSPRLTSAIWGDAQNVSGGYIYFDNTQAQWNDTYIYLIVGHDTYLGYYRLNKLEGTNLYYASLKDLGWGDAKFVVMAGHSSSKSKGSASANTITSLTHFSDAISYGLNTGTSYMITMESGANCTPISIDWNNDGYSKYNYSQTIYKVIDNVTTSENVGTVSITTTKLSGNCKGDKNNSTVTIADNNDKASTDAVLTATVTLTASANAGYEFLGWAETADGTIVNTNATLTYTATAKKSYYAKYQKIYTVTISNDGNGSTNPSGAQSNITEKDGISISAEAAENFAFTSWTIVSGTGTFDAQNSASTKFYPTSDATIKATFHSTITNSLSVVAGANIESVAGSTDPVVLGESYEIKATPAHGYKFSLWTANPAENAAFDDASSATTQVKVQNGSVTVTASATEILAELTTANAFDAGTPSIAAPTASATEIGVATTATVTATAAPSGYKFTGWTLTNCERIGGSDKDLSITVKSIGTDAAATAIANYEINKYYIIGSFNGWGKSDANYEMTYDNGVYKKEVTFEKDAEFKINDGADAWWGYDNLKGVEYKELTKNNDEDKNIKITAEGTITFTIVFNLSKHLITFEGLTNKYSYVLMGVDGDWDTGIELALNPDATNEYVLKNQIIRSATDAVKVVTLDAEGNKVHENNTVKDGSVPHTLTDENIVLADGVYNFWFNIWDGIYIENSTATPITLSGMNKTLYGKTGWGKKYTALTDNSDNVISIYNAADDYGYGEYQVDAYLADDDITVSGYGTWNVVDGVETLIATLVDEERTVVYNLTATVAAVETYTLTCNDAYYYKPSMIETIFTGDVDGETLKVSIESMEVGENYNVIGVYGETDILAETVTIFVSGLTTYVLTGAFKDVTGNIYNVSMTATPLPKTPVVVENATYTEVDGDIIITGDWSGTELTVTLYGYATSDNVLYEEAEMETDDILAASTEVTLNKTTNAFTITGDFIHGWEAVIYTVTVSGALPVTEPETYTRTVTPGNYGTICLPYASSNYTGMELYEVSWLQKNGETPVNLYLDQLAADAQLEAGKPYIFRATSTELTVTYTGAAVTEPVAGANGLTGSFVEIPAGGVLTGNYVVAQTKFWTATADAYAAANRAYIDKAKVPYTEQKQIPGRRRVALGTSGENAETGIDNIITTDTPVKVIENGQLIIIRNGEKFNVQGQKL